MTDSWTSNIRRTVRGLAAVVVLALGHPSGTRAQDRVHYRTPEGDRTVEGRVVDFRGADGLTLDVGSRARTFPTDLVLRVETARLSDHVEADRRFEARQYATALPLYRAARNAESRVWVRRLLTARIVWCCRARQLDDEACAEFELLLRSDPQTPYFDCIPLAWSTARPSAALERKSEEWLGWNDWPAAQLLGASRLLATSRRAEAIDVLRSLRQTSDIRVASLATAQLWRTQLVTAGSSDPRTWQTAIDATPVDLRAGPYYLLGQAYARAGDRENAVLAWMRVPILYPLEHPMAADCLIRSAETLWKLDRAEEALTLCREVLAKYDDTPAREKAETLLSEGRSAP